MARQKAILQSEFPYHISARCINREWFSLSMDQVWSIMSEELFLTHYAYNLQIHSFVLMSNHFHLIASTPDSNISSAMNYFMSRTSGRLTEAGNRINQTFAGRHFKCVLNSYNYYLNAYKYNYRNPIGAGLCTNAAEYHYSTLHGLLGQSSLLIPVQEDQLLFPCPANTLQWLNTSPSLEKLEAVKIGLRRQYFKSPRRRSDGKKVLTEDETI